MDHDTLARITRTFHIGAELLHETVTSSANDSFALVLRLEKWVPGRNDLPEGTGCLIRAADGRVSFASFAAQHFVDAAGREVEEPTFFVALPCFSPYGLSRSFG